MTLFDLKRKVDKLLKDFPEAADIDLVVDAADWGVNTNSVFGYLVIDGIDEPEKLKNGHSIIEILLVDDYQ